MWRRFWPRLWEPIRAQLQQGLAPSQAALAVALGLYLAVVPALGTSTLLCALAAFALRLNQPVILSVSWLAYPLQFVLLLPFFELGAWAFGGPRMTLSLSQFLARAGADPWGLTREFWWIGMHAIGVWAVLGLVVVPLLWLLFHAVFVRAFSEASR